MTTRYATLVTNEHGQEEVSTIGQFEGGPPEVRAGNGTVEKVADGVLIGMVRGGPVTPAGGFGFPEGTAGTGERGVGVAKPERRDDKGKGRGRAATAVKQDEPAKTADTGASNDTDPAKAAGNDTTAGQTD